MILAALSAADPQRIAIAETVSNQEFSGILPRRLLSTRKSNDPYQNPSSLKSLNH
jgi:hypothetical protein